MAAQVELSPNAMGMLRVLNDNILRLDGHVVWLAQSMDASRQALPIRLSEFVAQLGSILTPLSVSLRACGDGSSALVTGLADHRTSLDANTKSEDTNTQAIKSDTALDAQLLLEEGAEITSEQTLIKKLDTIIELFKPAVVPSQPKPFDLKNTMQVSSGLLGEKVMLKFQVQLKGVDTTDANNKDVAQRTLSVKVADTATIVKTVTDLGDSSVDDDGYVGQAGDSVTATLIDSDASGNNSPPASVTVTLADDIAPDAPNAFGIKVTGQV